MSILNHTFPPITADLYDEQLGNQLAETQAAISSLNQLILLLQNPFLLMRPILAKEAEASSLLEGTQASLEDAYKLGLAEQTAEKRNDAQELRNYEQAMLVGLNLLGSTKFSNSVIKLIHARLLNGVRGRKKNPGEYRKDAVWIGEQGTSKGDARYLPPDALQVPPLMDALEYFYQNRGHVNPIIASAILHHRFEAIHPFKDGNGRTGRLAIPLYLVDQGLLKLPVLYLSGYFDNDKEAYINALAMVDNEEDWRGWILYYLKGMELQAKQTLETGIRIKALFDESKELIAKERVGISLHRVLEYSFTDLVLTAPTLEKELGINTKTGLRHLELLTRHEVLVETDTFKKRRIFINEKLLNLLRAI